VSNLAEHLDDENVLVRYHLCTALVVVGCVYPAKLVGAGEALLTRLKDEDENPYVRGRAAEAIGLLTRAEPADVPITVDDVPREDNEAESFVVERIRFARQALAGEESAGEPPDGIGTVQGVRRTTGDAVVELTKRDGDGKCPHCGLALPGNGPPTCPRCGAPY
jgi:hypothetical protein